MQYTTLGRTGLKVSVAGLGTGGFSRLGLGTGHDEAHAVGIIRQAMDLGVNLIDTAAVYGTEDVVAKAIRGTARDQIVLCTKASKPAGDQQFTAGKVLDSLDGSLKRLGVETLDIYQLHRPDYLMDPAEFEKDAGMRKSLAQLRRSFSKYRDRTEREVYHTLSAIRHVIEVQPIR